MGKVVQFTVLRFALLLVPLIVLVLLGVPPVWALLISAVFSMVTSLFLLRGMREEMARELATTMERRRAARQDKLAGERTDESDEDLEAGGR